MSFLIAAPELVAAAAADLANVSSTISVANAAAAFPTASVVAAGADEVSATVAALFGAHAQAYQALSAQAARFPSQFVQLLNAGASSYAGAEAANAAPLQTVRQDALNLVNAPSQLLTGRPLIGNGADGAPVTCQNGGNGGWLFGSGATGGNGGPGGPGRWWRKRPPDRQRRRRGSGHRRRSRRGGWPWRVVVRPKRGTGCIVDGKAHPARSLKELA